MGFTTRYSTMIACCLSCMLDIIWNAVEDEYLTVIMYLLCSIPMRFSGKTSQMIHNEKARFINDQHPIGTRNQLTDRGLELISYLIAVPHRPGQQVLHR